MIFLVLFIIACNKSKRNINTNKHQTSILAKDLKLKMENNEMLYIIDVRSKRNIMVIGGIYLVQNLFLYKQWQAPWKN